MSKFKSGVLGFVIACFATFANASILSYDIVIDGSTGWTHGSGMPYGMGANDILSGSITVDNVLNVIDAFSLTAGTKIFSVADIHSYSLQFDSFGSLSQFSMSSIDNGWLYSSNTFYLSDRINGAFCNGCVSFQAASTHNVSEPASLVLVGLGLAGFGAMRRRKQAHV